MKTISIDFYQYEQEKTEKFFDGWNASLNLLRKHLLSGNNVKESYKAMSGGDSLKNILKTLADLGVVCPLCFSNNSQRLEKCKCEELLANRTESRNK